MNNTWKARITLVILILMFLYFFRHFKGRRLFSNCNLKVPVSVRPDNYKTSNNKNEEICRRIIEGYFNAPFPSVRPDFLKSPRTKRKLELDCYNKELGIALEYNGKQHYEYCPIFHKSKKDFYSQVYRDDWKRKRCQQVGVTLIEVPYWQDTESKMKSFIVKELKKKIKL